MHLTRREFQRLVLRAFDDMPPSMADAIDNVAILVEDWPDDRDLQAVGAPADSELFGLYTGVPLSDRGGWQPPLPDKITLFQRPIEEACVSREQVVHEIRVTLLHEVGHYLGMSEDDLERLGYG